MNFAKTWRITYLGVGLLLFLGVDSITKGSAQGSEATIVSQKSGIQPRIDFVQNLSLKPNKDDKKTSFQSATLVEADSRGNIYIFSSIEKAIQVYDPTGVYIRTIGKKGQGPDEFEIPLYIVLDKNDNLFVFDFKKGAFLMFDSRGQFVDIFSTQGKYKEIPSKIIIDPQQNIIVGSTFGASDSFKISKFNKEFVLLEVLYVKNAPFYNTKYIGGRIIGPPRYAPTVIWTMDDRDNLYACYNKFYEIGVYSPNHQNVRKITNTFIPEAVSISEIENEVARSGGQLKPSDFPKQKPAIYGLYIIKGYLFILTAIKDTQYYFDVFDTNGNILRKVSLDFLPRVYKNGHVYSIKYKKDSRDCEVLRYKVEIN